MNKSLVFALALCASGAALAGSKFAGSGDIIIVRNADGSGSASGYLGAIYNGPSTRQWMGCQRSENDNVFCHAIGEAAGSTVVSCTVQSAFLAQSVSSISPDVRLLFQWNAQGVCTRIQVAHSSEYQDKQG
jgi:hypothetical protein